MFKEYSKFHTCEDIDDCNTDQEQDEDVKEEDTDDDGHCHCHCHCQVYINSSLIIQQLIKLINLLEFDNLSMIKKISNIPSISFKNFNNPQEFYKLLVNYNQLVEMIIEKNNELILIKFKCHEIINNLIHHINQPSSNGYYQQHQPIINDVKSSTDEICKKLQDIFNPKEEFDSTL